MLWDLLYLIAFVLVVVGLLGMLGLVHVGGGLTWVVVGVIVAAAAYFLSDRQTPGTRLR